MNQLTVNQSMDVESVIERRVHRLVCGVVFMLLLATYWLTTPDSVSYWDCPEYVSAAYLLEIGHPPGNPVWMLVEHIVTLLSGPEHAAYAVNLSSGLFTALAGMLLASVLYKVTLWLLRRRKESGVCPVWGAAGTAAVGALCFGWCDSSWYSAVEAEVYAMSIFFTALTVWLMVKWMFTADNLAANRLLVLLAYVFGLSIGVHQLNLLAIPALSLIWGMKRGIRSFTKLLLIVVLGALCVGVILIVIMPKSISAAAWLELLFVNRLGMPMLTGVVAFVLLLGILIVAGMAVTLKTGLRRFNLAFWMASLFLIGYGAYALVPIRGGIPSPANSAMPGEPFSFARYQAREQYGAAPLFYGYTPYSKPLFQEEWKPGATRPEYVKYAIEKKHKLLMPYEPGARMNTTRGRLLPEDSAANARLIASGKPGYIVKGYSLKNIYTPELNSFLPRITSRNPVDIASFADWVGMDTSNMRRVEVSEALDTLGNPVPMMDAAGNRVHKTSYKPTAAQHLRMLGTYQIGYMYFRYLMWNFAGRQNDIPSQGEVQHGNFIFGIDSIDNVMLGAEDYLPAEAGSANPGRNRYFGIPLLLGILGLIWLLRSGHRGRQVAAVSSLLFVMTGIAIVIYLNQSPGEPRERDYSFLGSFWAYSIWIGYGALWVARMFRTPWAFALTLMVPAWMCTENWDDHDRSGRRAAATIARITLESLDRDAVIFVDGDNFTFPLWYAQEVEGIRTDVRVVNLSYLGLPGYAANMMRQWRESKPVNTTLKRGDIIYDAFTQARIRDNGDTLAANEQLQRLKDSGESGSIPEFPARYASIRIPGMDRDTVFDMRKLSETGGGRNVRFAQLIMFDMLANAGDRPIYWFAAARKAARLHLDSAMLTPSLTGDRFGKMTESAGHAELMRGVDVTEAPNATDRNVYMDATPARMVGQLRAALIKAARTMLSEGRYKDAYMALYKADVLMGTHPLSYPFVADADVVRDTRYELGRLQLELARHLGDPQSTELRARGLYNLRRAERRKAAWRHYRKHLPERLRGAMAPLS